MRSEPYESCDTMYRVYVRASFFPIISLLFLLLLLYFFWQDCCLILSLALCRIKSVYDSGDFFLWWIRYFCNVFTLLILSPGLNLNCKWCAILNVCSFEHTNYQKWLVHWFDDLRAFAYHHEKKWYPTKKKRQKSAHQWIFIVQCIYQICDK